MRNSKTSADDLQDAHASQIQIRFANETREQRDAHRKIALKYKQLQHKQRRGRPKDSDNVRIGQLERFSIDKFGPVLPNDPAGRNDVFVMANCLAHSPWAERRLRAYLTRREFWMSEDEFAALVAMVMPNPRKWTADELADRIGLDDATRTRLQITIIGSTDVRKAERVKRRKEADAAKAMARRAKAGARPHAASAAQTEPWKDEGISRSTYFRRKLRNGNGDTISSAAKFKGYIAADETVSCGRAAPFRAL